MPDNTTYGTSGDDILSGGNGTDTIYGGDGNDIISGGNGVDTLFGEGGDDQLTGDLGADHLTGGADDDTLDGSLGFDTAYYSGNIEEYTFFNLAGYLHVVHQGGAGADGHDQLIRVERLVFANAVIDIGSGTNAPVAGDDHVFIDEDDGVYNSGASSVLDNDFDFDGDPLSVTAGVFVGTYGTLTLNSDGTYSYALFASAQELAQGENVQDSFNYTVSDNDGSDTGALVFHIAGVNDGPAANPDTDTTGENAVLLVDVLANDTDIDNGAVLTVTAASAPVGQGTASVVGNQVEFDPGSDFDDLNVGDSEVVVVSYTIEDEHGASDSSTLTITVTGTNDGPVANPDTDTTSENAVLLVDVLANDTDPDAGATLTVTAASAPVGQGTASVVGNQVEFDPGSDFDDLNVGDSEEVVVSYTIEDEHGASDSSTLTITVTGTNDGPVANPDVDTTGENAVLLVDVLANDTDIDNGAVLTVTAASAPVGQGTASVVGNQVEFDPGTDFDYLAVGESADVVVGYDIEDEHGASDSSTLTVTVTGTNDAPTIDAGGTDATGAATELPNDDPNENTFIHTDSGDIAFDDVDVTDTHSASFTPQGGGYLGTFSLDPVNQAGDTVGWDFSVADSDLDFLADGETLIQTYTVEIDDGNGGTATQDVTVTLTGAADGPQTEWYIDNSAVGSANTGTQADPFTSIAAFNAAQGTMAGPQAGHSVFLLAGTGTYAEADGINLLDDQVLEGVAAGPLRPTIEATSGDGINVAQNNTVSGLDVGNTSGADIADSGGTVGTLTISDVGTSGTGQIVDIDQGGTLNVTLNSAESLGSSGGAVDLAGVGGSFTVTGATTITGVHAGGGIDVTGSAVAASFAGGGTVATLTTTAVNYVGNTGSLTLGGGLDIVTTSGSGLNATGGGTVTVTGAGNSVTSTTGVAVTISGTAIGAADVTFESVSANGAASGIVLANTGALGGFNVTGTGVAASGGTIQNTTGSGVSLTNTSNVLLDWMTIANTGSHGVAGTGVTDASGGTLASFAFTNGLLDSVGDGDNESALFFDTVGATNITGRLVVSNTTIQNFEEVGIHVGNVGGTLVIDVTDTVFNNNSDLHGEEGIDVDASGTANITLNVIGTPTGVPSSALFTSTTRFTDLEGGAINAVANGSGVLEVNVDAVLITGTGGPDNFPTPPAITLVAEGTSSSLTFDIFGNRIDDSSGDGIVIGQEGTLEGRIAENTITNTQLGDGIRIDTGSTGGNTATILIQDNVITNIGDDGIQVLHPDGTKTLNLTIDGNTIQNTASEGIRVFADDDVLGGGPLTRLQITDNVFGSNGTLDGTDSVVVFSQDPGTEIFSEINGNSGLEGLTVRQALSAFMSIEQASLAALSADNGGAFVTGLGTITFSTPVSVPQPDNWL